MAKAKTKPYTAAQNRLINSLALTLVMADVEKNVIKPGVEKTGKPYDEKNGLLQTYFKNNPDEKRAWQALQKAISKARKDVAKGFEVENQKPGAMANE